MSEIISLLRALVKTALLMAIAVSALALVLGAIYFPYSADDPSLEVSLDALAADEFYEEVYSADEQLIAAGSEPKDHEYVVMGKNANEAAGADEAIAAFVNDYHLEDAHVLEVGAGSGQLQDIVDDYTGLDIAASAARYFHKPFVHGSATDLPFADGEFDAVWTVWTLEHVPNPELALSEMRRITKPGGLIFLAPAWNCGPWLAQGYPIRPYSDFGIGGKLTKASLSFRANPLYEYAHLVSSRLVRRAGLMVDSGPTTFRYKRIQANYDHYWMPDSDAVVTLDPHEAMLWYSSRGDACLNCPKETSEQLLMGLSPLVIQVNKKQPAEIAKQ
ncbi:MAG: class I SAM-dependent methyltransferase [Acidobacteria bacterium]|nr:class I SAM-dependent methyltransferase [Acidobacteriota bacterium]MDA1234710.1 class I SAM-dependent methyltransferase [Acidobacteriota bacterium]